MMALLYKIISKLITNRLKQFMITLFDLQHKGFIAGRKILDNILAYRVGKEYVHWKKLLAIFLMLDF